MHTISRGALTLSDAERLVKRAIEEATQTYGRPISITVSDPNGEQIAFVRMDGAPARSVRISQQKAYTAARMGIPTDAFLARLRRENIELGWFCDSQYTALPGGTPLKTKDGTLIGSAGCSGLTPGEDQAVTDLVAALIKDE